MMMTELAGGHVLGSHLGGVDGFDQPLPAKHVDVLLGISAKERRRWSKDGCLPSAGQLSSSRTQRRFTLRVPPFALAAETWARTTVLSNIRTRCAEDDSAAR